MSRFDNDDYEEYFPNQGDLWWANVQRALKGRKGQKALRELREAMISLPEPKLVSGRLATEDGGAFLRFLGYRPTCGCGRGDLASDAVGVRNAAIKPPQSQTTNGHVPQTSLAVVRGDITPTEARAALAVSSSAEPAETPPAAGSDQETA